MEQPITQALEASLEESVLREVYKIKKSDDYEY